MTDSLTDAVRRLKGLQADVERLKAERDQEGVPRLFFSAPEDALAVDTLALRREDILGTDTVTVDDTQTGLVFQDLDAADTVTVDDAQTGLVFQDLDAADTVTVDDTPLSAIRDVTAPGYNSVGYNTSDYDK
jgi:pyruvate kinase